MGRILYVASTASHLRAFHMPYIRALSERGHTVLTMASGEGADFNIPFEKKLLSAKNTKCRKMIRKIVDEGDFDLILLNTSLAAFHVRAALPRRKRPRIVNIVHGYLFPLVGGGSLRERIKRRILLTAERIMRGKTDAIITMNAEDTAIAKKYKLTSGEIVECRGMGVPVPKVVYDRDRIRCELSASDAFVLLFVGEYSGRKNQEYLISLMPKIKSEIGNAVLWLVGEGDSRPQLESMISTLSLGDSVMLLGRKENAVDYMRAADVYISASFSEGLPFNIVEALGVGLDVVASDVKGQRDILSSDAGVLFSLERTDDAVSAVTALAKGTLSVKRDKKEEAYARYSFENTFNDTLGIILKVGFPEK